MGELGMKVIHSGQHWRWMAFQGRGSGNSARAASSAEAAINACQRSPEARLVDSARGYLVIVYHVVKLYLQSVIRGCCGLFVGLQHCLWLRLIGWSTATTRTPARTAAKHSRRSLGLCFFFGCLCLALRHSLRCAPLSLGLGLACILLGAAFGLWLLRWDDLGTLRTRVVRTVLAVTGTTPRVQPRTVCDESGSGLNQRMSRGGYPWVARPRGRRCSPRDR